MKETITGIHNPRIKNLKKLDKASERKAQQLFMIEGLRESVLAHRAGYQLVDIYCCEELLQPDPRYPLQELMADTPIYYISKTVYESLAYRGSTEGIIATAKPKSHDIEKLKLPDNPLLLVIEAVEKPGNLGAMLRTADAAAVDAVIICDARTDIYNPNVIRSSIGTVFTNQIALCETKEAIRFLKQQNICTFAAAPEGDQVHYEQDFNPSSAVVVGAEATGLSDTWITEADKKIKIPMQGKIDSLNVSVSAGIILFEALRQRLAQGGCLKK